jgi:replication factor C subunit 1
MEPNIIMPSRKRKNAQEPGAGAPPKKRIKAKDARMAAKTQAQLLQTRESLAQIGVRTIDDDDISVLPVGYIHFAGRAPPEWHGRKERQIDAPPNCLQTFVFIITGILDSLERDEATKIIVNLGGKVTATVTKSLTHAIVGREAGSSKIQRIKQQQVPMINEDGFFDLIRYLSRNEESKRVVNVEKCEVSSTCTAAGSLHQTCASPKSQICSNDTFDSQPMF